MAKAPFPALAPLSALALGGGGALRSCPPTEGWWVSALALGGGGALTDPLRTRRCMSVRGSVSAIIGQTIPIADSLPGTLLGCRRGAERLPVAATTLRPKSWAVAWQRRALIMGAFARPAKAPPLSAHYWMGSFQQP